jgi:hypothetical protein
MNRLSRLSFLLASTLLIAEPLTQEQMIQKANEVSGKLLQTLGGELKTQMQAGGAMQALNFCSHNALALTDNVAKDSSVEIKRVSDLNRNPINAATAEEKAVLNEWRTLLAKGQPLPTGELKKSSDGRDAYYKPIVINNEACLKCHGGLDVNSPLAKAIKTTYPEDKAIGYKMGDLRGMVVVTFPKDK